MTTLATVILAAGEGTRMKSTLAKVLHPVAGRPLVDHAVEAARALAGQPPVLVVGTQSDAVRAYVGARAAFVEQAERRGTGHAVQMAAPLLRGQADLVLVCYADMPLLRAETLRRLVDAHTIAPGDPAVTMLTFIADDPRGFGRIVRRPDGTVEAIVEEAAATPQQRAIRELNVGVYVFDGAWLWDALDRITPTPPKNEYYLTDVVALANADGRPVLAMTGDDPDELIGINTRVHLAEAEAAYRRRINREHMLNGVTIVDPATTYIEAGVQIGMDTVIQPNTHLRGRTMIGSGCLIGPNSVLVDATVGDDCTVFASVIQASTLERNVEMGPFVRIRGRRVPLRRRAHGQLRGDQRLAAGAGVQDGPLQLRGRRRDRRGRQHRRGHDHVQLRRRGQAQDDHRGWGLHRLGHDAGRAGDDRRGGADRGRGRGQGRGPAGQGRGGRSGPHHRGQPRPGPPRRQEEGPGKVKAEARDQRPEADVGTGYHPVRLARPRNWDGAPPHMAAPGYEGATLPPKDRHEHICAAVGAVPTG